MKQIITKNFAVSDMQRLSVARANGAYASLKRLFEMKPSQVIEEVRASGLRGRGGAGFPTGDKWAYAAKIADKPHYLVVNADESEPGTFKDRAILEKDPHLIIEGILIAAYAIDAKEVYVYFRGEYFKPWKIFFDALEESKKAGLTKFSKYEIKFHIYRGAGAYVCGEETALLNSIEGKRGLPRIKPPYPSEEGLFGCPTAINNIETLASLPFIIREDARAFRSVGTEKSPGTKLISASGHINNPGVYEVEMGRPFALFLSEECGGTIDERRLKAVIPGGPSVPALDGKEALRTSIDFESMAAAGTQLGSGGMIILDESASMPDVLKDITRFFDHESCGQCTPCREGSAWAHRICDRLAGRRGLDDDVEQLLRIAENVRGRTVCAFGDALANALTSFVTKFGDEFGVRSRF